MSPLTDRPMEERHQIVRVVVKLLVPIVMLYALYVQAHGDFGPGGGFQAGVLFAAGFIAFTLVFGVRRAVDVVPPDVLHRLMAIGLLLYGSVGVLNILQGAPFLDYRPMGGQGEHADPAHGIHYGILLVELGVGITVASVMTSIFFGFAARTGRPGENIGLPTAHPARDSYHHGTAVHDEERSMPEIRH